MKMSKMYIAAAGLLLAGLAVFLIGFAMTGFHISKVSTQSPYQKKEYTSQAVIRSVTVDDSNLAVKVSPSPDDRVHITYYENDRNHYEITESADGTLSVVKKIDLQWYSNAFNVQFFSADLTVALPASVSGAVTVSTSNGSISVKDIAPAELALTTSNASITAERITGKNLTLSTSNGSVTLSRIQASGDVESRTSSGKITLEDVGAANVRSETSNGPVSLKAVRAGQAIRAENSNGRIVLEELSFGTKLDCETSNGDIRGTLPGKLADYSVTSETSNGRSSLPERMKGGEKSVNIKTSNASIVIEFEE